MAQVRDRAGKIHTVSAARADQMVRSGQYQLVTTKYSTIPDLNDVQEYDDQHDADVRAAPKVYTYGKAPVRPTAQYQGPGEDRSTQNNRLSPVEGKFVNEYWANMQKDGGALYWNMIPGEPDENGMYSPTFERVQMGQSNIENDADKGNWSEAVTIAIINKYMRGPDNSTADEAFGELFGDRPTGGGSGGRGGGGGGAGPKYIKADRDVTEDRIKSDLISMTGSADEKRVTELADQFDKDRYESWKAQVGQGGDVAIDPSFQVLKSIREQDDYKRIHKLRGEADDEMSWIGLRNQRLQQLGLSSKDADERAVGLAQAGTALAEIDTGMFQTVRGRKDITLMNSIEEAATNVAGQL